MKAYTRSWFTLIVLAVIVVGVIALWPRPARAAGPWYVAPGGSDGNSCLSANNPCATINGAIGKASSGDTIKVATGTYTGSTGSEVMLIDKSITLSGGWNGSFTTQSSTSTIDGQGARRGITVNGGLTATVERFVVQNGSSIFGGGIRNSGTLTVTGSLIWYNLASGDMFSSGGGIQNESGGTLTLNDSTVSNNTASYGGGLFNSGGFVTLNNSTVSDNTATTEQAGGIQTANGGTLTLNDSLVSNNTGNGIVVCCGFNPGSLTLNNSLVSGNTSRNGGGGIANYAGNVTLNNSTVSRNHAQGNTVFGQPASGGGFLSNTNGGSMNLNNSTVSGNTADGSGGGLDYLGPLTLNSSTISGNVANLGGGMHAYCCTTLKNTILAGNTASTGPDCYMGIMESPIGSAGYNLIGNTGGCGFAATTGDLLNVNPLLFPLIGWPGYHPLLPGSPAIDAGNPAGCTDHLGNPLDTDQTGIPRVGRCDIGAFEYDPNNDPLSYVFLPLIVK